MELPPPLPVRSGKSDSLANKAAIWSIAAPILAIALSTVFSPLMKDPNSAMSSLPGRITVGIVLMLIAVSGLISGVIALCNSGRDGAQGALGKGLAGMILSAGFILLFAAGFLMGIKNVHARKEFARRMEEHSKAAKDSFDEEKGLQIDPDHATRVRRDMEELAGTMKGDEAKVFSAGAAVLKRIETLSKEYQRCFQEFEAAEVLKVSGPATMEEFARKRKATQELLKANDQLKMVLSNSTRYFREELVNRKFPPLNLDRAVDSYQNEVQRKYSILMRVRNADTEVGVASLAILDLLEQNRGQWKWNKEAQQIQFETDQLVEDYNKQIDRIQQAAAAQIQAQRELVGR